MVRLEPAVYWRLRYLQADGEKHSAAAALAEMTFRAALAAAGVPATEHRWDDAQTALVPVGAAQETGRCEP